MLVKDLLEVLPKDAKISLRDRMNTALDVKKLDLDPLELRLLEIIDVESEKHFSKKAITEWAVDEKEFRSYDYHYVKEFILKVDYLLDTRFEGAEDESLFEIIDAKKGAALFKEIKALKAPINKQSNSDDEISE